MLKEFSITGQWGAFWLVFAGVVTWLVFRAISHLVLDRYLASIGFKNLRNRAGLFRFLAARRERIDIGRAWFLGRTQYAVIVGAYGMVLLALYRSLSVAPPQAQEFARAGALVTIAGLTSLFMNFHEDLAIPKKWRTIFHGLDGDETQNVRLFVDDLMAVLRERAQVRAQWTSFAVSVVGTLIWAYGDQVLVCGSLPLFHVEDKTVSCLNAALVDVPPVPPTQIIAPRAADHPAIGKAQAASHAASR